MTLCPAQVTSRANSDLLSIEHLADRTELSTPERMARIIAVVDAYKRATDGTTERSRHRKLEKLVNPYEGLKF